MLGDGSYMFRNPVAVHHAAAVHKLPVLFVVINNAMWGAVRRATLGMYPQGEAARSNKPPFIDLDELPAFEQVCAAAGGYGERVEDPAELPAALRARAARRQCREAPGAPQRDLPGRRRGVRRGAARMPSVAPLISGSHWRGGGHRCLRGR